jgi:hypothetical protein
VFFCWQHKDQIDQFAAENSDAVDIQERASLETGFRNLGLEEIGEEEEREDFLSSPISTPSKAPGRAKAKTALEQGKRRHRKYGDVAVQGSPNPGYAKGRFVENRSGTRAKSLESRVTFFESLLGCFSNLELKDDQTTPSDRTRYEQPNRRSKNSPRATSSRLPHVTPSPKRGLQARREQHEGDNTPVKVESRRPNVTNEHSIRRDSLSPRRPPTIKVYRDDLPVKDSPGASSYQRLPVSQPDIRRPLIEKKPVSSRAKSAPAPNQTSQEWMPQIPPNPTDAVRIGYAKLLTAMSGRPTKSDDWGYIYMFWQTDLEQTCDESIAAASIVGASSHSSGVESEEKILQRRFFRKSSISSSPAAEQRTIFLKIGRAGNVQQRMSQWRAQCKYNISLLRYYPQGQKDVARVPFVGKVERVIHLHLEMLGKRVRRQCRCGTEHKEWFEIDATTKAVREVDEIIRQWVAWSIRKYSDDI